MTPGTRVHVVMPAGLIERIDSARGEGQSRGDWVRRAVERALEESGAPGGAVVSTSSPAPAEQPDTRAMDLLREDDPDPDFIARGRKPELPRSRVPSARQHLPNCKCPVCS